MPDAALSGRRRVTSGGLSRCRLQVFAEGVALCAQKSRDNCDWRSRYCDRQLAVSTNDDWDAWIRSFAIRLTASAKDTEPSLTDLLAVQADAKAKVRSVRWGLFAVESEGQLHGVVVTPQSRRC